MTTTTKVIESYKCKNCEKSWNKNEKNFDVNEGKCPYCGSKMIGELTSLDFGFSIIIFILSIAAIVIGIRCF